PHHIVRSKFFFGLPQIHLLVAVAVSLAIAIACEPVIGAPSLCLSESVTIQELKNLEEEVKRNQSLKSLLLSPSGDFVISYYGNKSNSYERCTDFTFGLVEFYDKLRSDEESFEIVMIPLDDCKSIHIHCPMQGGNFKSQCIQRYLLTPLKSCQELGDSRYSFGHAPNRLFIPFDFGWNTQANLKRSN
ncbi:hypothetical protein S245_045732, partial [Arachis hypogaea]